MLLEARRFVRRLTFRAGGLLVIPAFSACPSQPRVGPSPEPPLIGDERLCRGDPADPRAERDPRCATVTTHEPVELVNHFAGCRAGPRGAATFKLGAETLATLAPGERKIFMLPRGDVSLTIVDGERSETRELSLEGTGPLVIEVGCAPGTPGADGLRPLVLLGAPLACAADAPPVRVRAGGLELEVGPGQAHTVFVPRGSHLVKVGGATRTVDVGADGAVVPLGAPCEDGP